MKKIFIYSIYNKKDNVYSMPFASASIFELETQIKSMVNADPDSKNYGIYAIAPENFMLVCVADFNEEAGNCMPCDVRKEFTDYKKVPDHGKAS